MEDAAATAAARSRRALDRMIAFSDGVYAIAITLLALDVRLPSVTGSLRPPLAPQLIALLPNLFAFALSFVVIGGYWVAHHRLFTNVERYDTRLLWLNLLVLFFIAVLPFPTQVVAEYGDTRLGVQVYASAMTATGAVLLLMMLYAHRAGLMAPSTNMRVAYVRTAITPAVFALSMLVAMVSPQWASLLWFVVAIAFFVVDPIINSNWGRRHVHD